MNDLVQHVIDMWAIVEWSVIDDVVPTAQTFLCLPSSHRIWNIHCDTY